MPRRTIRLVIVLVLATCGSALGLVIFAHQESLPEDVLVLEIAAGLLLITIIGTAIVPFRLHLLHRKLQRTLENLESGTLSAAENPLGSLGVAFQEHYRLLWRSNVLLRGSVEVHQTLIRNLMSLLDAGCIVLDGKGVVQYRSEAAAALGSDGETFGATVNPSISEIISILAGGEQIESVTVTGAQYHCYPVFGPVLLRRSQDGGLLLQSRDGLAFVLLIDRPLKNVLSRTGAIAKGVHSGKGGILQSLERIFSARK